MDAAALLRPEEARYVYLAGRVAKCEKRHREAERWLRRASSLAYRDDDWLTYALSLKDLGMLAWDQGVFGRARSLLFRALRYARKQGDPGVEGVILHNIFVVRVTGGDFEGVEAVARQAFERYLPYHDRLPALAYDLTYYWLTRGYAFRAIPVLRSLVPHFKQQAQRLQVLSALGRAAGAVGDLEVFQEAWKEASSVRGLHPRLDTNAAALSDFGFGAAHLGLWETARACFEEAAAAAEELGQSDMLIRAEAGIEAVSRHENPDTLVRPLVASGQGPDPFMRQVLDTLESLSDAARKHRQREAFFDGSMD
ncbi:MAG TPA: hypothetical protein VHG91_19155 [Longimicrobium sp.]|nr:hypothetical protein [Longimicrobium sp.]